MTPSAPQNNHVVVVLLRHRLPSPAPCWMYVVRSVTGINVSSRTYSHPAMPTAPPGPEIQVRYSLFTRSLSIYLPPTPPATSSSPLAPTKLLSEASRSSYRSLHYSPWTGTADDDAGRTWDKPGRGITTWNYESGAEGCVYAMDGVGTKVSP